MGNYFKRPTVTRSFWDKVHYFFLRNFTHKLSISDIILAHCLQYPWHDGTKSS